MTNIEFVTVLAKLQVAARAKNKHFAARFDRTIEGVLACPRPIVKLSATQLAAVKGITPTVVKCVHALARGVAIDEIVAKLVPDPPKPVPGTGRRGPREHDSRGEWSGSWDNAVKVNEG